MKRSFAVLALLFSALAACASGPPHARASSSTLSYRASAREQSPLGDTCGAARFWTDGSVGRTWQQAREMCRSLGGDLASIHDEAESVCANRMLALTGSPPVGAWVGLSENQQEGAWRWSDGSGMTFTRWLPGEPNNDSGGPNDCGHVWRERAFQWNDIPCSRTDPTFLCRLQ